MQQNYELYFILNPDLDSKSVGAIVLRIEETLKSINAKNLKISEEGLKKLAYPIKKHQTGHYVLINFDLDLPDCVQIKKLESKLNSSEEIIRFLILNQTEYLKQKSRENLRETEINNHRELNKGKKKKICLTKFLGIKAIDYKDITYLDQFTSPYAKIFGRNRTGTSSKYQRKIKVAIKRARHMALMPFTTKHFS